MDDYLEQRSGEVDEIEAERRVTLDALALRIEEQLERGGSAELLFVCTHNSRRSQMAQVWARVAAASYRIEATATYSGGTEATAFSGRAVAALERAGLSISRSGEGSNPTYDVHVPGIDAPLRCWSKTVDHAANPQSDFVAVMTCSDADDACPLVPGSSARVAVTYEDPKDADGTDAEAETYDERCAQIAREMLYVFRSVAAANERST